MQYNSTSDSQGICQEIDGLCDSDTTSYPVADKTRRVNAALEQIVGWIINADGTWQFDDTNYTDFPIGTYTLVASQAKYSFNDKFLQLLEVQVMDSSGNYQLISSIDPTEVRGLSPLEEIYETAGFPSYYDLISDDTIKFYPAPSAASCTLASGLKIKFKRTSHPFTAADTTAEPGFASPYHIILPYMASIPYCMVYHPNRIPLYERKVFDLKNELIKHYSYREKDKRKIITFEEIPIR